MTSVTVDIGSPRSLVTFVTIDNRLPHVFMPIILLQHGYCTFVITLFGPSTRLFINLTMCTRALFTKSATTLGLVEQAFWRVPFFTEWIGASSFELILAWPSKHSSTGTSSSGTSVFRRFLYILLHERIKRRIRLCHFCSLIASWRKLQVSPLEHCPSASHCQQSPRFFCPRCFVPWFLTTAFLS